MNNFEGEAKPSSKLTILWIILFGTVALFSSSYLAGYLFGYFSNDNTSITTRFMLKVVSISSGIGLSAYAGFRLYRNYTANIGPIPKKEKLNRNILIIMGVGGLLLGLLLALISVNISEANPWAIYDNTPISAWVAIIIAITLTIFVPIMSYFWHTRAIDEQESQAVGNAAVISMYFYLIAAPTWWFLWRGGIMPEYNGVIIYALTTVVVFIFWLKNKYF